MIFFLNNNTNPNVQMVRNKIKNTKPDNILDVSKLAYFNASNSQTLSFSMITFYLI